MSYLTEAQLDVLTHLARGKQHRRGRANFTLRSRGLSEFVWACSDGRERGNSELSDDYFGRGYDLVEVLRERITPAGRAAIARERKIMGKQDDGH